MGAGNLFMMCETPRKEAFFPLPSGFHFRLCREEELEWWKGVHFDREEDRQANRGEMDRYFEQVYAPKGDLFFRQCLVVCDREDHPVGTCFLWKSYDAFWAVHWFKVVREQEGKGLGRALLSQTLSQLPQGEPVFLHTHPACCRAVKLYTDFGFALLSDPVVGDRENGLEEGLAYLKGHMTPQAFAALRPVRKAPAFFLQAAASSPFSQF